MKPLDEIEPRIAINAANTPGGSNYTYRITQPGSYYLTGNVTVTTNSGGIRIEANDVTIDLMGYRVENTYTGAKSYSGIDFVDVRKNVVVKNGSVKGFSTGVANSNINTTGIQMLDVRAIGNVYDGFYIAGSTIAADTGGGSVVRNCIAESNGRYGIYTAQSFPIDNCVAKSNASAGIFSTGYGVIKNCVCFHNAASGIYVTNPGLYPL